MAVNLRKGQKVSLEKAMTMALVGLGWRAIADLDASAFLVGANGLCFKEEDFVFYNQRIHPSNSVIAGEDVREHNVELDNSNDQEQIFIDFMKIPTYVEKIEIVVTIHSTGLTFGEVENAYVRLAKIKNMDDKVGETVIEYNLEEEFSTETGVWAAEIFRSGGGWKFRAVGEGFEGGLKAACANYGIDAEE